VNLNLDPASSEPLYRQIVAGVRAHIRGGSLPPGQRLPTVRQLAGDLGISRLTAHAAYAELQSLGLIESVVGRGTFIAEGAGAAGVDPVGRGAAAAAWSPGLLAELVLLNERPNLLSFAQAHPAAETYPVAELQLGRRASLRDQDLLGYGSVQGNLDLREQVARLVAARGLRASADDVLIVAGAQQGLDVTVRALTGPEDTILVEAPTYPGLLELAAQRGQPVIGIPRDAEGPSVRAIEAACVARRPRLLYVVPTFSNPAGQSIGASRRTELLGLAKARDLILVEDDHYGLLPLEETAPPSLKSADDRGRVVYVTSFSKILLPGLRLGAVVTDPAILSRLVAIKRASDLGCSPILQAILADYLRRGRLEPHLRRVRPLYRERRDAMLEALQRHLPSARFARPEGGLSVWIELPGGIVERDVYLAALERGVGVARGQSFWPQPSRDPFLRLSYGSHSPEEIERGVAILGQVLREHDRRRDELVARAGRLGSPLV
jgi:DNA-binding transcriptional MocR family regulator